MPELAQQERNWFNTLLDTLSLEYHKLRSDVEYAMKEAKLREPDYPWSLNTATEAVWALGESMLGVMAANKDCHEKIAELEAENCKLREQLKIPHPARDFANECNEHLASKERLVVNLRAEIADLRLRGNHQAPIGGWTVPLSDLSHHGDVACTKCGVHAQHNRQKYCGVSVSPSGAAGYFVCLVSDTDDGFIGTTSYFYTKTHSKTPEAALKKALAAVDQFVDRMVARRDQIRLVLNASKPKRKKKP